MRSSAHMGVGVAVALAVLQPSTTQACATVVAGAAVGSVICDIDIRSSERQRDAFRGRMVALVLAAALLAYDYATTGEVWSYLVQHVGMRTLAGLLAFASTCVIGALTPHRSFAHSLAAFMLWYGSLSLVCPPLAQPFAWGVGTHLVLDLMNKKGLRLFWPLHQEVCLGLCKADGVMDGVLAVVGTLATMLLLVALLSRTGAA